MDRNRRKLKKNIRTNLSSNKRTEVLNFMENGELMNNVRKKHHAGNSTISGILKRKDEFQIKHDENNPGGLSKKKKNTNTKYPIIENKVLEWYEKSRQNGTYITGPMIMEKASEIHTELGSEGNFQASKGWLHRFKCRNDIKLSGLMDVKTVTVSDMNVVHSFTEQMQSLIQHYNLSPEQIYNADETDLFWKLMPKPSKDNINGLEANNTAYRERMTLMACTNATGSHKLPLVCIGRKSRGITSENISDLSIVYYSQETAWMDTSIFQDWYHNIFVPSVRDHLKYCGLPEVALLVIDQNPAHPNNEILKTTDDAFSVLYLSTDIKALLQPMQLGIIHDLKSFYRYSLLSDIIYKCLVFEDYEKQLNILDSLKMLSAAWDSVSVPRIQQAFSKVLSLNDYVFIQECEVNDQLFSKLIDVIPECILYNYTLDHLKNWLFCDSIDNYDSSEIKNFECDESEENFKENVKDISDENFIICEEIDTSDINSDFEDWVKDELDFIEESDCLESNVVSADDAIQAIDILLSFIKKEPRMDANDAKFLLELKDTIYYKSKNA